MTLEGLPRRRGEAPRTQQAMPHQQLSDNAPADLQERLYARIAGLPGVVVGPSHVSVPGARAFHLAEESAPEAPEGAFMAGREFAHLHPAYDGSLHLVLPEPDAADVVDKGWGELHPMARAGAIPKTTVMIFGPRDDEELEIVSSVVRASYEHARRGLPG